jgi:hypothetical protein
MQQQQQRCRNTHLLGLFQSPSNGQHALLLGCWRCCCCWHYCCCCCLCCLLCLKLLALCAVPVVPPAAAAVAEAAARSKQPQQFRVVRPWCTHVKRLQQRVAAPAQLISNAKQAACYSVVYLLLLIQRTCSAGTAVPSHCWRGRPAAGSCGVAPSTQSA